MNEKRNAPAGAATPAEAAEALNITPTKTTSSEDFTTELADFQGGRIYPLLKKGAENAMTTKELKALLHCPERTIRELVEQERRQGALVLADPNPPGGYFRPSDGSKGTLEMLKSYHTARAKALGLLAAVAPAYRELRRRGALTPQEIGQISIEEA